MGSEVAIDKTTDGIETVQISQIKGGDPCCHQLYKPTYIARA
jgi:hypothetical protein